MEMEKLRASPCGSLDSQTRRITTPKFPALIRRTPCRYRLEQDYGTVASLRNASRGNAREIRFAIRQSDALRCENIREEDSRVS